MVLNPGALGATVRADEIAGVHIPVSKIDLGADGTDDGFVSRTNPLPIRSYETLSPQITFVTQATVAAGGAVDLDSAQIASGKIGRLLGVLVSSSVAIKAVLVTVSNGVASITVKAVGFTGAERNWYFHPPGRNFFSAAHDAAAGFDGFRVTVTNMDTSEAADVFVTYFFDEDT